MDKYRLTNMKKSLLSLGVLSTVCFMSGCGSDDVIPEITPVPERYSNIEDYYEFSIQDGEAVKWYNLWTLSFFRKHTKDNIDFYSLNGTGVAIDKQAVYYVLENVNNGIILTENMVDYDYEKLHYELDNRDYPNKETFEKYINKL